VSSSSSSSSKKKNKDAGYDVVVIGGGHAGCEAASAAARVGARTALVTQRLDTIGEMSCNPSVGGIGKGHLVREVDALGGLMGRAIDRGGIHFRMLNRRKGEAVWGPRAQADRDLYKAAVRELLDEEERLEIVSGSVEDVELSAADNRVQGVRLGDGTFLECAAVVLTTGTFLRGRIYLGLESFPAGRKTREDGHEPPANALAVLLEDRLKLPLGRLKTGTPPRLDGTTINWKVLEPQESETPPFAFSFLNEQGPATQEFITCYRTHTNENTHRIVMEKAHTLAAPSVDGTGPRYCPSIYKKVERFGHRSSHGVWLEPEGLTTDLVYPNGLSGAYPEDVQREIVHSIRGLEDARVVQPGYDVEYDFVDPTSLNHDLQLRKAPGLFLAGQICGTTGYEEAAALGIVAGANAGLASCAKERFVLSRRDAYVGVLVDDLVTRGTKEPYRMFTSRAEYRLRLRADNADLRLTPLAARHGLASPERLAKYDARRRNVETSLVALRGLRVPSEKWYAALPELVADQPTRGKLFGQSKSAAEILQMPRADLTSLERAAAELRGWSHLVPAHARDTVAAECKYGAYLDRQDKDQANLHKRVVTLPPDIDYSPAALPALSAEEREKLQLHRPKTLADASAISGITPASLVYLYNHVREASKKRRHPRAPADDDDDDDEAPPLLSSSSSSSSSPHGGDISRRAPLLASSSSSS